MKITLLIFIVATTICFSGELIQCENDNEGEVVIIFDEDNLTLPSEALAVFESNRNDLSGLKEISLSEDLGFEQRLENAFYKESYSSESWNILYDIEADIFVNPVVHIIYRNLKFEKCIRTKRAPSWLHQGIVDLY